MLTCPQGHQWKLPVNGCSPTHDVHALCPVCGAAVELSTQSVPTLLAQESGINTSAQPAPSGPLRPDYQAAAAATIGMSEPESRGKAWGQVTLPGYEIQGELGRGGMGVVYKALQVKLKRLVAVKMILVGAHAGPKDLERFRKEAEAVARLRHPNIVQIYEVGEQEGLPFFSLELLDGGSLARQLHGHPQPARPAAELIEILARAVHAAHQQQIIHRDLKPANILLMSDGTPKIADFGLAKELDSATGPTQDGAIMGTSSYMAPEQAFGQSKDVTAQADVYALGAILYEMLTGGPPFKGATKWDTLDQVRALDPVPPSRLQPKVPRDLETICMKCLQKEPRKRYASALALAEDLHHFLAGEPIQARPAGAGERLVKWAKRHPGVAVLLVLTSLVAAIGFGLVTWQWQEAEAARDQAVRAQQAEAVQLKQAQAAQKNAETARQAEQGQRQQAEAAWQREAEQRALAEAAQHKEEQQRKLAEAARQKEAEQKRKFQRLSVSLLLDRGLMHCEQGDVGRGLLWLAHSLQTCAQEDTDLQQVIRVNLAHWRQPFRPLRAVLAHGNWVHAAVFSPDGKLVLTASGFRSARLWDAATGKAIGPPLVHANVVRALAFSPDGTVVLTGSGGMARLWEVGSGKTIGMPLEHPKPVHFVAFSPNGNTILTACGVGEEKTGEVRLWEAATGQPLGPPLAHQNYAIALAFSPDSKTVLTGHQDRTARLWSVATGQPLGEPLSQKAYIRAVAFSPDSKTIVIVGDQTAARLWNVATGKPIGEPMEHQHSLTDVAFSPDGKTVVTAGNAMDKTARLWNAATGKAKTVPLQHRSAVTSVAFSPDGKTVVTGSRDNTAQLWETATGQPIGAPLPHQAEVLAVAFSSDGKTLLTRTREKLIRLWEASTAKSFLVARVPGTAFANSPDGKTFLANGYPSKIAQLVDAATGEALAKLQHQDRVIAMAFSPDGSKILTGSLDQTAQLWERATGEPVRQPLEHPGRVWAVAFSLDGKSFLTASYDLTQTKGEVQRWETATGKAIGQPLHFSSVNTSIADGAKAFSPDAKTFLAVANGREQVRLWDIDSAKPIGQPLRLQNNSQIAAVAFSPDGKTVLTASDDGMVQRWETADGKAIGQPLEHSSAVKAMVFSRDGKTILTGCDDRAARLWDAATGKSLGTPLMHQQAVRSVAFSPDGKTILTGISAAQMFRWWDVATRKPLGMPFQGAGNQGVAFSPNGKTFLNFDSGSKIQLWALAGPLSGEVERLVVWTEVITGLKLDAEGVVSVLDGAAWQERRQRLEELGRPPLP